MSTIDTPARNLRLVDTQDFESLAKRPFLLVHGLRTVMLVCILLVSVVYQIRLGNFLNTEIWLPVYAVLFGNFLLNSIYLLFFERISAYQKAWNTVLFALDAVAVTLLIHFTGTSQSLFMFLYLVNLILASLVFTRDETWFLTCWTSVCFSALLLLSTDMAGQSLYFSLTVNNLAFVAVTLLSGRISDQLTQVGARLQETQSDLTAMQNLNESLIENIASAIVLMSRTGFVQYFNRPAAETLGQDQFQQQKIQDVLPELQWPWDSLVNDESKTMERRELRVQRGEVIRIVEVVITRFREADGRVRGWLLLIDDRTELKVLEENMRQQEKLAAVGQLAAGIAHEIRNPLASISGSVQMMLSSPGEQSEENLKLMRIMDKEINRLNGLISEFLEYVRPEKKAFDRIDLNASVREALESLQFNTKIRKDVLQTLELNAKSDILGDRNKLKQVLLNFILNAYQAMDKTDGPRLKVSTVDDGEWVVLIIEDNGCGIKPENLKRIFEPFHTTKPQGTGLGLAVTHKILQAFEAKVSVGSEVGVGTRFVIEFPAVKDIHTEGLIPFKREAKG